MWKCQQRTPGCQFRRHDRHWLRLIADSNIEGNYPEIVLLWYSNTLRRNKRHFADDIFKCILLNENVLISIKISLKFTPKGPINNIPALLQVMAWRRPAIIWTNDDNFTVAYMRHSASMS